MIIDRFEKPTINHTNYKISNPKLSLLKVKD
jgi:hypothetical protein